MKQCIDSEMKKFMKSHLELFAAHHSLQHKINSSNSECDTHLDRTAEMLQVATNCSYSYKSKLLADESLIHIPILKQVFLVAVLHGFICTFICNM